MLLVNHTLTGLAIGPRDETMTPPRPRTHRRARGRARGGAAHDRRAGRATRARRHDTARPRRSCSTPPFASATSSRSARARSRMRAPSSAPCAPTSTRSSPAHARARGIRSAAPRQERRARAAEPNQAGVHLDRGARAPHAANEHRRLSRSVRRGTVRRAAPLLERPLGSVRRNAHRLKRLVNDMLDVIAHRGGHDRAAPRAGRARRYRARRRHRADAARERASSARSTTKIEPSSRSTPTATSCTRSS